MTEPRLKYSRVAMTFHWLIALLVIVNWRLAESAHHAQGAVKGELFGYHKAIGITVLALTLGRIAWRLGHKSPPLAATLASWEKVLARTLHTTFYVLLIALPLGGWIANSLNGRDIDFFGLFTIPALPVGQSEMVGGTIYDAHALGGEIMIWLIALHILAALKHTFWDKDGTLFRMLPSGTPKG